MDNPTTKAELLKILQTQRALWESILSQFGHKRMIAPNTLDDWSVKDVIAHIMSYELYILDRLREVLDGETYIPAETEGALAAFIDQFGYPDFGSPLLDDDEPNRWVVEKYRPVSLDDMLATENQVYTALRETIERASETTLQAHDFHGRIANNSYVHYQEHIDGLQALLEIEG